LILAQVKNRFGSGQSQAKGGAGRRRGQTDGFKGAPIVFIARQGNVLGLLRSGRVRRFGAFEGVCRVGRTAQTLTWGSGRGLLVVFLCPVEGGRNRSSDACHGWRIGVCD